MKKKQIQNIDATYLIEGHQAKIVCKNHKVIFTDLQDEFMHGDNIICTFRHSQVIRLKIKQRKHTKLKGTVFQKNKKYLFKSNNNKIYQYFILNQKVEKINIGKKIEINITQYPKNSQFGYCDLIHLADSKFDFEQIKNKILNKFNINYYHQPKLDFNFNIKSHHDRKDYTHIPFITIDPVAAKDFDDAIYVKVTSEGYLLYVAIADVAEFIQPQSLINQQALQRGNSIYMPHSVLPMLPEILCENYCSLIENTQRLALVCKMQIDKQGHVQDLIIEEGIIKSHFRFTYQKIQDYFDTNELNTTDEILESIIHAQNLYKILKLKKTKKGMIEFNFPEQEFIFNDRFEISDIIKGYQNEAQEMIEHLMIVTNESVASFCFKNRIPIFWRNHPVPDSQSMAQLRKNLKRVTHQKIEKIKKLEQFNKLLDSIKNEKENEYLEYIILRTLPKAFYSGFNLGHFGLASNFYCHFTSPIRRYADLRIHQNIKLYLHQKKVQQVYEDEAKHISEKEIQASKIERKMNSAFAQSLLVNKLETQFEAKVSGMNAKNIFIEIQNPYVEGTLALKSIKNDFYRFNQKENCYEGKNKKQKIKYGKKLIVSISELDPFKSPQFQFVAFH